MKRQQKNGQPLKAGDKKGDADKHFKNAEKNNELVKAQKRQKLVLKRHNQRVGRAGVQNF